MDYSVFDAHCDTLCYLLDNGGGIDKNTYHIDSQRMSAYKNYTQVFACFIAPEYRPCANERCMKLIDTYYRNNINGIFRSLQWIYEDGTKRFEYETSTKGVFLPLGFNIIENEFDKGNEKPIIIDL